MLVAVDVVILCVGERRRSSDEDEARDERDEAPLGARRYGSAFRVPGRRG
jgi:hypothetical protein